MRKNGKMQRVVMGILAVMLMVSLVLAVASFVMPSKVHAGPADPDPVEPEYVCGCCDGYWSWTCSDQGRWDVCIDALLYDCRIKRCWSMCSGCGWTYWGSDCYWTGSTCTGWGPCIE